MFKEIRQQKLFFKKNFVYKVTYYTTDDPEYAIRTTTAPNTSIVTVGKGVEERFYVIFKNDYSYEYIDFRWNGRNG